MGVWFYKNLKDNAGFLVSTLTKAFLLQLFSLARQQGRVLGLSPLEMVSHPFCGLCLATILPHTQVCVFLNYVCQFSLPEMARLTSSCRHKKACKKWRVLNTFCICTFLFRGPQCIYQVSYCSSTLAVWGHTQHRNAPASFMYVRDDWANVSVID